MEQFAQQQQRNLSQFKQTRFQLEREQFKYLKLQERYSVQKQVLERTVEVKRQYETVLQELMRGDESLVERVVAIMKLNNI